ncbi:hypothetical protein AYJ57_20445 (plasmid) [Salipiger sp. CCB-MM3]|uniref:hypothetical protein n=1 Tax=Salipiger sp. CCB-MM3 TaxID=1792508 RepID=UPI00080A9624|nr:hypothetical protein [Salipiger sp. CCB-MM3]ANT62861.1 hypothetical protein AYJ57_20445 [Salipiger sp. CCB-MM3]
MDSTTLKLVVGGEKKSEKMPDVFKKVTPGKVSKYLDFKAADTYRGFSSRTRRLQNGEIELAVAHLEYFDSVEPNEVIPSEGHTVLLFDEKSHEVLFRKHLPESGDPFVDQEKAYLLAAAVEASRMSFVADGAEFLTSYLAGERVDPDLAEMAFDLVREDQFEALGEGDDELLWAEFADALHEKIHGFAYDMETALLPAAAGPVMA